MDIDDFIEEMRAPTIGELFFGLLFGAVFIAFSFPIGLTRLGNRLGWSWVYGIGATANRILINFSGATSGAQYLSFQNLWLTLLKALAVYLAALLLLSIRHWRLDLFFAGVVSLSVGTAILHLLAWFVYIGLFLLTLLFRVLGWILQFLGFIMVKIFEFLAVIIIALSKFFAYLFSGYGWVIALVVIVGIIVLAVRYRSVALQVMAWILGIIGALAISYLLLRLLFFIGQLLAPFFAFLMNLLSGVFQFLAMVFRFLLVVVAYLIVVFLVGFVIYGIGAWLLDLFRGAWSSGNGARGVIIGALAIGTALALILLETNLYNLASFPFYPIAFAGLAAAYFHHAAPIFDMLMAILVVGVSVLGIFRNLVSLQKEPSLEEFQVRTVMTVLVGILIGAAFIFVAGQTEHN